MFSSKPIITANRILIKRNGVESPLKKPSVTKNKKIVIITLASIIIKTT